MNTGTFFKLCLSALIALFLAAEGVTAPITLQNATADDSEAYYDVSETIDGDYSGARRQGWSPGSISQPATAVWETQTDLLGVSDLTFTMYHLFDYITEHFPRRIRWSVTNDDRSQFADGAQNGGDVTANWVELSDFVITGPEGLTFTVLEDNSILLGGTIPATGVITMQASSIISGVTGIRLEALVDDESGRTGWARGNDFVLTELELDAVSVSEPNSLMLFFSMLLLGAYKRKSDSI